MSCVGYQHHPLQSQLIMLPADTRDEGLPERSLGRHHRGRFGTPYGGKTKESRMDEDSRTKHDKAEAGYTS